LFHPQGPTFFELAREALSSTEQGYDLLAPKFDVTPFRTPDAILRATAEYLKPEPPERLLDLCCGTGAGLEFLLPLATKLAVGLDFSRGMLAIARNKTGAPVVRAQALAPPFREAFDLVTCFSALGHFLPAERRALVAAVRSCLRPGGRFLIATAERPSLFSRSYWLSRAFNAAMHVRNAIWSPPFIMYYLSFLLPDARMLLEAEGFEVRVKKGLFPAPYDGFCLLDAARRAS
jgi:SAM-dependent methyltransferase